MENMCINKFKYRQKLHTNILPTIYYNGQENYLFHINLFNSDKIDFKHLGNINNLHAFKTNSSTKYEAFTCILHLELLYLKTATLDIW